MAYTHFRQPRYFGNFHCIGSNCPDNCCYDWQIDWKKEEVEKLKSAPDCSPELKELIENAFTTEGIKDGNYRIEFNEQRRCPLLTEDGWCRIQRELGVEYMSNTCMVYPRRNFAAEPVIYRSYFMSCREVMKHLMNDEKAMDLISVPFKKERFEVHYDSPEEIAKHPELKYRGELLEFFYEIIADKKHDVETNIIIGALAAQALTKLVERGETDKIPETLKQLKAQTHNGAQLKSIENIKPNLHLKFGFIGEVLRLISRYSLINFLNDKTGTPNIDYYNAASVRLQEIFKDRPFFLRNIALNLLLELYVPVFFGEKTIFENYSLFAIAFACLKMNMTALALTGKGALSVDLYGKEIHYDGEDKFLGFTSMLCRELCQNLENEKAIIALLEEKKFTSPAYIALLVK